MNVYTKAEYRRRGISKRMVEVLIDEAKVQNMLLMYIFCIPLGNYLKKKISNRIIGAVVSAFLFQTLMITSAALIAII